MIQARTSDYPIVALCTPTGSGALAIIRLSGEGVFLVVDAFAQLPSRKPVSLCVSHTIQYGYVVDQGEVVDQVLFMVMRAPSTFTGEDTVEINCHNNPFIIERIIALAVQRGARLAEPGEFSKRAVLNRKIDLTQAEAINEVVHAQTQSALKLSLSQLSGSLSRWIIELEEKVTIAIALTEASFEFLDEENIDLSHQLTTQIQSALTDIEVIKKSFDMQQHIRNGIRIALIGSTNAGKSTLFNKIAGQSRSIVTSIPGTTRDTVEIGLYQSGTYVTYVDTAGLRVTNDIIEQEGIRRSFDEAEKADIVLLIFDQSATLNEDEKTSYKKIYDVHRAKTIVIANKSDLRCVNEFPAAPNLAVSHVCEDSISILGQHIAEKIKDLFSSLASPFLLNQRQFKAICAMETELITALSLLKNNGGYEIISQYLRDSISHTGELTGSTINEKAMDTIFRSFCVGK